MVTKKDKSEKTVYKALGLGGLSMGGAPCAVDVKDDKIIRVRPLHYDSKYSEEHINRWTISRNGVTIQPPLKSTPCPYSLAYKKRAFSPNRIKFPLKRVDFDPKGERNTQNRGVSKYKRISWDEAAELVASEYKRVHEKYGPLSVLSQADGHGECKTINAPHGCQILLHDTYGAGNFTQQCRNPDSWEGWYWGSMHVWGTGYMGMAAPMGNQIKDVSEYTELILAWGCDPETTPWGAGGQIASLLSYFWTKAGIRQVYICPELNYGAAIHADKWIPVLPNTDAALQLAIIYTWVTEGTYDKKYVKTHVVGMDKVADYVLGKEDGVPKTPAWASPKCGVPEWTIKALASEFASYTTSIMHHFGGSLIRGPFSHEPARLECILLGMQGLGKPGVHQARVTGGGLPRESVPMAAITATDAMFEATPDNRFKRPHSPTHMRVGKQILPKTLVQEGILNPPITFFGDGSIKAEVEDQFVKYTYPIPKEEGGTEIHMVWTDTPCRLTCWNDGNKTLEAMRSPKIEFIVAQHPWLENDCLMADVVLPSNTTFEVDDIVTSLFRGIAIPNITLQRKATQPIGESKSDYEVVLEVAKKLGKYEAVTRGKTLEDLIKDAFKALELPKLISWEEFNEKGYYVYPPAKDWEQDPVGLRDFYLDPVKNPLKTPSGKLEFYSERLAKNFPDDMERPPIPKWIEKSASHDERISSERAKKYPLLLMSNHGRWRHHSQCDDITWTREALTCKVKGSDGYMYEPLWLNPITAAQKSIQNGDIVKAFNERGTVLCAAYVTERMMPGVSYVDHGARVDWIIPGKLDRGGAINLISPTNTTSKNAGGQATSGYLVQVEKVCQEEMDELRKQYPDAFNRKYDPASGLRFDAWVEGGME